MKDPKMCCSYNPKTGQCKFPEGSCGKANYSHNKCQVKGHPKPVIDIPSKKVTNHDYKI